MSNKKLVLIDGYGIFFRAFFAQKSLTRSDGLPTNGIYGFTRMILNLIMDMSTTHLAIIFDTGKKNFRHEMYPAYKANRPAVPVEMIPQFPYIREVASALNIKSIEMEGFEADDIIATLAREAEKNNFEIVIVSTDKDLMQLIDENISMFDIANKKNINSDAVKEKWGVYPNQLLDFLSLLGDSSDNVPGVPGIGEKTAVQLINEFGNLDNLIDNLENIKQKTRREAIQNNLNDLFLSKKLITLRTDIKLNISFDDLFYKPLNPIIFKNFLLKMEFFSIARQIDKSFDLENKENSSLNINNNSNYKKILDLNSLQNIINEIFLTNNHFYFIFLFNEIDNTELTFSISFLDEKKKQIYYLNIEQTTENLFAENKEGFLNFEKVIFILKNIFENNQIKKITYNIKNLFKILIKNNIELNNFEDIAVISYLLDAGKFSHNFSDLIKQYLQNNNLIKINYIENNIDFYHFFEKNKKISSFEKINLFDLACSSVEYIQILYDILNFKLSKDLKIMNLYQEIDKPLIKILAKIENNGVKIATNELNNLSLFFIEEINKVEKKIFNLSGEKFNISSPKQLSEILFTKLNIPIKQKVTKSGNLSTNAEILEELYEDGFEIAGDILEYRHYTKLQNTYTDVLPKLIDKDNRIHTYFLNTNVITGRLSSNNPNLQNIPIKTIDGEKIRKTFIAKDGYSLIGADYSQIELRILAEYAKVNKLLDAFSNNIDIHIQTAKEIFKVDKITSDMRQKAKAINFSIIYGTSAFGLAKRLGISNLEAKQYIENYFKLYPEILDYMYNIKQFVKENGFVNTLFNRKCYIDINNAKGHQRAFLERLSINAPIQGTGADIIKKSMILLDDCFSTYKTDVQMILQVHDELLFEVKTELADEISGKIKNVMENVTKFKIPLVVNVKVGKNWGDVH